MASSSTPVSDEEVQKANDGLMELSPCPIPEGFKSPGVIEQEEKKQEQKKLCVMPPEAELVEVLLNNKAWSPSENEALAALVEEDSDDKLWKDTVTLFTEVEDILRRDDDERILLAAIQKLRHDLETKGCITYEVTDDEEEDDYEGAQ